MTAIFGALWALVRPRASLVEAIAQKRDGEITQSAATSGPKGLKASQL